MKFSYCMQLVLCGENTVYYIKIHLKCVFGFKIIISKSIISKWSNVFLSNLEKFLYLILKYPRNCLRVILFIFLLTIFEQVAYTTITEFFPNCIPAFPLHFSLSLVILGIGEWLENIHIWPIIYSIQ